MNPSRLPTPAALALVLAACSGAGTPTPDGGTPTTDLTVTAFAEQYCATLKDCCAKADLATDGAACQALFAWGATSSTFDAAAGAKCLASMKAAQSDADFCSLSKPQEGCDQVLKSKSGTKTPGEACSKDADCASSTEGDVECYSVYDGGAETRSCMVLLSGKLGDKPCVGTRDGEVRWSDWDPAKGAAPVKGYVCDLRAGNRCDKASMTCLALKAVGEACSSSMDCASNAWCDFDADECAARKAVGEACTSTSQCVSTAYCGAASKCVARLADGASCGSGDECASGSCVNTKCTTSASFALQLYCGSK